jgi:hypothetical protein
MEDPAMSNDEKPETVKADEELIEIIDKRSRRNGAAPWAFALVAIVLILTVGYVVLEMVNKGGKVIDTGVEAIGNVLRPNVKIEQVISNTIGELKKESKLVVFSTEIMVYEKRESTKKILWDMLNLGTTVVELRVPGNKVQYIIPTDLISKDTIWWDEERGEVVIDIPTPVLDEEIVEIQSDPSRIEVRTEIGWGRLKSFSGDFLELQIRQNLRSLVIKEGKRELLLEQAHKNAEEVIRDLFQQFMRKEKVEVPVRIN